MCTKMLSMWALCQTTFNFSLVDISLRRKTPLQKLCTTLLFFSIRTLKVAKLQLSKAMLCMLNSQGLLGLGRTWSRLRWEDTVEAEDLCLSSAFVSRCLRPSSLLLTDESITERSVCALLWLRSLSADSLWIAERKRANCQFWYGWCIAVGSFVSFHIAHGRFIRSTGTCDFCSPGKLEEHFLFYGQTPNQISFKTKFNKCKYFGQKVEVV